MAGSKKSAAPDDLTVNLKEITQIVDLMAKNDLTLFHWERGGVKLELRRGADPEAMKDLLARIPPPMAAPVLAAPAHAHSLAPAASHADPPAGSGETIGPTINSPMVGTFYRASSPGEKAFASVGDSVDENSVVCIIEAMKVMNEIKAEVRGTIAKVLVEDGRPVQYGQPLFELRA